jgi:sulfite reductase alpha subunit-like flavoprotein
MEQQMDAVVLYESWFGNTRRVAERIAEGLRAADVQAQVCRIDQVDSNAVDTADLIVIGGPTHAHSISNAATRIEARHWAEDPDKQLTLDTDPSTPGLREWLEAAGPSARRFAAFSTRADLAELLSGSAAHSIRRRLHKKGWTVFSPDESFIVPVSGDVVEEQLQRAESWGRLLGSELRVPAAGVLVD